MEEGKEIKIQILLMSALVVIGGITLFFSKKEKANPTEEEIPEEVQTEFYTDCNNLPFVLMEEDNEEPYQIKSMQYSENGICLRFRNNTYTEGMVIHIAKDGENLNDYHLVLKDNYLETDLNLATLENGNYTLTVSTDKENTLLQNLDLLNQLVRGKIQDKLVTFSYPNNTINFTIEDFQYEYDILIDPGHGGIDGGTLNDTVVEKDLNLMQSLYEKKRYEEHGLKVLLSREDEGDGMLTGSEEWNRAKQRGYAVGYYAAVSKYIYSNHHNYTPNANVGGFEIIVPNLDDEKDLEVVKNVYENWLTIYPESLRTNRLDFYSRNYEDGEIYDKSQFTVIDKIDWYATTRIPDQLYNSRLITYEGCYLQNTRDFNWYYKEENWKKLSEAKIKAYVEALGKEYIPVS